MDNVEIKILSGIGAKDPAAILVQTSSHHILLDAGGALEKNASMWQMPERIDAVFLSHDHFDHVGNVHNIPLNTPIYCSEVTASSLPDHSFRNINVLPIKGIFQLGNLTITTGANGHAYGGMWFHLDCGGGIFFSGDVSLSSLLYHFDEPPKAKLALLDASYGLYNLEQGTLRHLLKIGLKQQTLLPVPPSGRAIEIAFWLLEEGITDIALDEECRQFLMTMMNYNDGSLHEGIGQKLESLYNQLSEMDDDKFPSIILAGHPDGRQDESGRLRELPNFQHRTIFTGYCDAQGREELELGKVDFYRWNVHPTTQELKKIIQMLQCEIVVPLFFNVGDLLEWENTLNVQVLLNSHISIEPMIEPNFIEQSPFLERKNISMKLMRKPFILIRHGETEFNKNHLIGGKTDIPLTKKGREQAKVAQAIVAKYKYDAVITTPLIRAKETADILFPDFPKEIIADLRERDWGKFEGESQQFQPPYEETPPNGEAWQDFCERVVKALNDILNRYDSPIIIAHSGVFRVIQQLAKGTPYGARVGNVEPYYVCAGDESNTWHVVSLVELEKKVG